HLRLEIALPPKPVLGQNIKKQLAKGTLEPPGNRDAETLLRPVEYCLRKDPTHGALEDVLRAPAVELDGERQLKNMFDEVHIEQRYARFERGHHAGAVELHEDVVFQIELHVKVEHLIQWVAQLTVRQVVRHRDSAGRRRELLPNIRHQQGARLIRGKGAHPTNMALTDREARASNKPASFEVEADVVHRHGQTVDKRGHDGVA